MHDYMFLLFQRGDSRTLANEAFYLGKEHPNGYFSYHEFENKCLLVSSMNELSDSEVEKIYEFIKENSDEPVSSVWEFTFSKGDIQKILKGQPIQLDKDSEEE